MSRSAAKFWEIKDEIRVVGVDDGPFEFGKGKTAFVVGVVFRGGSRMDAVLTTEIEVDGNDVTDRLLHMVKNSRHRGQIRVVMTDGLTFGGFNIIDGPAFFRRSDLPLISVTRNQPDLGSIKRALRNFPDFETRWEKIKRAGEPLKHMFPDDRGRAHVFFQSFGIQEEDAHRIIDITSTTSLMPEPIRVAHMIASGVVKGESHGRV